MDNTEAHYQVIISKMMNAYALHEIILDENGLPVDYCYVEVNQAFEAFTGLHKEDIIGKTIREVQPKIEDDAFDWIQKYGDIALNDGSLVFECYSEAFQRFYTINAYSPRRGFFVTIFMDITGMKQKEYELLRNKDELEKTVQRLVISEQELQEKDEENNALIEELRAQFEALSDREAEINKIAYRDPLTEIDNRRGLELAIGRLGNPSGDSFGVSAVVLISVSNIKDIYETYGAACGDFVIKEMVSRIAPMTGQEIKLARIDGDVFALLFCSIAEESIIISCVEYITTVLKKAFVVDSMSICIRIRIGIAICPNDCSTPAEMLSCAMTALSKSSKSVSDTAMRYTPQMTLELQRKKNIESQLSRALGDHEFRLFYQPQFYAGTNKLRGFEALIRWDNPGAGMINPNYFIPIAEENGLIIPIGEWVLREACSQAEKWKKKSKDDFIMSINVSSVQFMSTRFVDLVKRLVVVHNLQSMLEIEITESYFIGQHKEALAALQELDGIGVKIALDDFGTGYSSFSYLKNLNFHTVKLDRSFIAKIDKDISDARIAECIIHMVNLLGMETIAEGVEKTVQRKMLTEMGCSTIQGYLSGRPVPHDEIERIFFKYNSDH